MHRSQSSINSKIISYYCFIDDNPASL